MYIFYYKYTASLSVTFIITRYNQEKLETLYTTSTSLYYFVTEGFPSANLFTQPLAYSSLFNFKCNPLWWLSISPLFLYITDFLSSFCTTNIILKNVWIIYKDLFFIYQFASFIFVLYVDDPDILKHYDRYSQVVYLFTCLLVVYIKLCIFALLPLFSLKYVAL